MKGPGGRWRGRPRRPWRRRGLCQEIGPHAGPDIERGRASSMSRRTRTLFNIGYLLVLAALVGNGLLTLVNLRTIDESDRWIDHTREVVIELERALSTLKDAETGQRGYLLTGDEEYLEPYRIASARMDGI